MEMKRCLVVFIVNLLACTDAFSRGAPKYQCNEMRPGHGSQSPDPSPFVISVFADIIAPGSQVEVNISSTDRNVLIMGILVQAKSYFQQKYVGSFVAMPRTKTVCDGNTGITHKQRLLVENLNLVWNAPTNLTDNDGIIFNVTIVQNRQVYWQGVQATPVRVSTAAPVEVIPDSSTPSTGVWQPVPRWNFNSWWQSVTGGIAG